MDIESLGMECFCVPFAATWLHLKHKLTFLTTALIAVQEWMVNKSE